MAPNLVGIEAPLLARNLMLITFPSTEAISFFAGMGVNSGPGQHAISSSSFGWSG
jgi:hypothetical protein